MIVLGVKPFKWGSPLEIRKLTTPFLWADIFNRDCTTASACRFNSVNYQDHNKPIPLLSISLIMWEESTHRPPNYDFKGPISCKLYPPTPSGDPCVCVFVTIGLG